MTIRYNNSFLSDLKKIKNEKITSLVKVSIDELMIIHDLSSVKNLKKIKGDKDAFRLRIRNYRMGFFYRDNTIILSRILDRKDIYKNFPK
ncbi:MAG: plasmid stabilization protein [Saprospiraceae bacterium]|jgi:mRNA-degrading endonuclease RelE of RelBE toxin-antitoxin system|nr:plasmid stabilization protein [Saprospiraceae bacterium]MBL0024679.1 plasmid stabilization protein [Saprospiraceae bacterium]